MNPWISVAGWVLIHFVWQGAALAIGAAICLALCRYRSAATRYAISCAALIAMLAAVGVTTVRLAPATNPATTIVATPPVAIDRPDVLLPISTPVRTQSIETSVLLLVQPLLPWIVSAWLLGVGVLLVRTFAGWWRVRSLHQRALNTVSSVWQTAADRIARRIGFAGAMRIVELPDIDVPLVVGCVRPIVVLPLAIVSQLNVAQVEAILAHELAHVRRHDYAVNLMQTLAETLLFYHPAVWWLSARIREEREHCCDDVAVSLCGDALLYAAALAEVETWRTHEISLAPAASGGSLLNRVRRILQVEAPDAWRTSPLFVALVSAAALSAATYTVMAQASAPKETFEVAAVRSNTSGSSQVSMQVQPGGRFTAVNVPLVMLIRNAYRLQDTQLADAPDWLRTERYDITAKAEGELASAVPGGPPARQQLMLQSLLEDRFKLKVHRETRDLPIYALVVARGDGKLGPQMSASTTDCAARAASRRGGSAPPAVNKPGPQCGMHIGFGQITGEAPMTNLATALVQVLQRSVIDRTGLTGNFNFDLRWTPDTLPGGANETSSNERIRVNGLDIDPNGPSIFTAIQEQLGLRLEATRGPIEVLVIDHVERPTPD